MRKLFVLLLLGHFFFAGNAQEKEYKGADLIHGIYLGKSLPLIKTSNPVGKNEEVIESKRKERENFMARKNHGPILFNSRNQVDPLHDPSTPVRENTKFPELIMEGIPYQGVDPPDPSGAIGAGRYLIMTNAGFGSRYQIFDSIGNPLTGVTGSNGFWSQFGKTGCGDPIVMYDKQANRWFLSEFACQGNTLLMAISTTSDPGGSYNSYQFTTPNFPDYPKYGIWHNSYVCTSNEAASTIYLFERDSMIIGSPARMLRFTVPNLSAFGFQTLTPVDWDGTEPDPSKPASAWRHVDDEAHFPGTADPNSDYIEYWEVIPDFDTASNSVLVGPKTITVSEFDSDINGYFLFWGITQPNSSTTLDPLREVLMQKVQYREMDSFEVAVAAHVTDVDSTDWAGMRWYEFRRLDTGDWFLYQEGTYAPDGDNRWMGCAAMDKHGNIALAYNVSSTTTFPSLRYTGRLKDDPLGQMTMEEQEIATGFAPNSSFRYGDYNSISIDPRDDETFWFTGEFNQVSSWSTEIVKFKLGYDCGGLYATGGLIKDNLCPDTIEAEVSIVGSGGFGNYEYSLDGVNYQNDTLFTGLTGGIYKLFVRDPDSTHCVVSIPRVKVSSPAPIIIQGIVTDPSSTSSMDGEIRVNVFPIAGSYTYSLDGVVYQTSNQFTGLGGGTYIVYVLNSNGCLAQDTFSLVPLGIKGALKEGSVKIFPNPNRGSFSVKLVETNITEGLVAEMVTMKGSLVQSQEFTGVSEIRFSGLRGGFYFLLLKNGDGDLLYSEKVLIQN